MAKARTKKTATPSPAKAEAKPLAAKAPPRKAAAAKVSAPKVAAPKAAAPKAVVAKATVAKAAAPKAPSRKKDVPAALGAPAAAPLAAAAGTTPRTSSRRERGVVLSAMQLPDAAPSPDEPKSAPAPVTAKPSAKAAKTPKAAGEPAAPARQPSMRLHKFLAHGGAGSRREAETFIDQGRVSVNGKTVTQMGFKVDPAVDRVLLDGEPIKQEKRVYFLLHKPAGFVCTNRDESGRPRAVDLLGNVQQRVYTVGRLDADSLGLILVTNDGDLANVVCHPRYRIHKRYHVAVKGRMTHDQVARLESGVWLAEGKSSPAKVVVLGRNDRHDETILEMTIFEGRNREIRRVFAAIGLKVRRLLRLSIGPLEIGDLKAGQAREVSRSQLGFVDDALRLYEANREAWDAELPPPRPKQRPAFRPRGGRPDGGRPGFGGGARREGFGGRRPAWGGAPRREGWGPPARRDEGPPRRGPDEGPARREGFSPRPAWRRPFDGPPGRDPRGGREG